MNDGSNSAPTSRHRAREVALQALFAIDLQNRPARQGRIQESQEAGSDEVPSEPVPPAAPKPLDGSEVVQRIAEHFEMPVAARAFAMELVEQISKRCDSLDATVSSHAKNWRVSRMAVVDRNILRLATYELIYTTTPAAVILDEAVELARRFGADESPPFVNGVLDAVAREVRMEKTI